MGVFIISPTDKGGGLYKPPVKFSDACAPVRPCRPRHPRRPWRPRGLVDSAPQLSPIEFNNLWLLNQKDAKGEHVIHTLVIGTARPSDFEEHMKSLTKLDQAEQLVPPIEAKLNAMYLEANGPEWVAGWWKGLPDPFGNIDGGGELVNVPQNPSVVHYGVIAWLGAICKAWDFHDFARQVCLHTAKDAHGHRSRR
jgi:predicted aldo/keto reductase-like oxidoreductase